MCASSLGPNPLPATTTFEADVQGHSGQRGVDDVAQIHLLLLIEVELTASTRGETEGNELLGMEAIQGLQWERH